MKKIISNIFFFLVLIKSYPVFAGPPFIIDDPAFPDPQHYEVYLFSSLLKNDFLLESPQLLAPALEIDWGVLPNLGLHLIIPYAWVITPVAPLARGVGDIETGVQCRILDETNNRPQIAFNPLIELPIGSASTQVGNGVLWMKLPLWMQKSWGTWTVDGGGGYILNPAPFMRNAFYSGLVVQKEINKKVTLGTELFFQDAVSTENNSFTILNIGGTFSLSERFSLLFSAGHSITGEKQLTGYLALNWSGGK